jgi:hypothetical protein
MWTTTFKRNAERVEEITHDFGNRVRIVTNLIDLTICRYHGDILMKEYTADPQIEHYLQFLNNVDMEVNPPKETI